MLCLQKGESMIYDIGAECGFDFSFYLVCGESNFLIDGTSEELGERAICGIKAHVPLSDIEAVFFTGTTPEKTGYLKYLLEENSNIKIFASVTGLRNIREVLNHSNFNGCICKHGAVVSMGGAQLEVFITPNLPNPDNITVYYKNENALFSGSLFSEVTSLEDFYYKFLADASSFIENALDIFKGRKIDVICRAYGGPEKNTEKILSTYNSLLTKGIASDKVLIAYSSVTGNNKKLACESASVLEKEDIEASVICLDESVPEVYDYSGLIIMTYTKNRSLPESVWNFISSINSKRAKDIPYFVFGSCGWSNEGPYIANETLSMLKLKKVCKVETCIFTPNSEDLETLKKNTMLLAKKVKENNLTENTNA